MVVFLVHLYNNKHPSLIISAGLRILGLCIYILIWISVMNTLYVRCQTKDYILDIVAARAGMRIIINIDNSIIYQTKKTCMYIVLHETRCRATLSFILVIHSSHLVLEHYSLSFSNSLLLLVYCIYKYIYR